MDIKTGLGNLFGQIKRAAETSAPIVNPIGTAVAKAVQDQFHPAPAGPVAPPQPPPPPALAALAPEQRAKVEASLSGGNGPAAQALAQGAVAQAATLPADQAAKLLNVTAMNPAGPEGAALAKILVSPAWQRSTPAQKGQLLDVAATASPKGLESLATLSGGDKLFSADARGGTLLSNLSTMTSQATNPALTTPSTSRQALLDDVLKHTADPNTVQQSLADTCSTATSQYQLAKNNPGEYARLIAGLAEKEGFAQPANPNGPGGTPRRLNFVEGSQTPAAVDTRDGASRLFQSAAIELANGKEDYDPVKDRSFKIDPNTAAQVGRGRAGLTQKEHLQLNDQLFNQSGGNVFVMDSPKTRDAVVSHLESTNTANNPVQLNFNFGNGRGHTVAFDHIENGRVFFKNTTPPDPQGRSNVPNAQFDPRTGLESLSVDEFKRQGDTVSGKI